MIQELFRLGPLAISPFGVLMFVAFVLAYLQLRGGLERLGLGGADEASAIVVAGGLAGIVGAKIYYAALYRDWGALIERAGLVWYGGFVAGTVAVLWVAHRRRIPIWGLLDATAPALALGYAVGRIGCFLVGDDYGRPTDLPWGVTFPVGLPPTTAGYLRSEFGFEIPATIGDERLVAVHPTQLYETAIALGVWWFARRFVGRVAASGVVGLSVLALLSVERFGIEFLRAKDDRFLGPFTLAQALALATFAITATLAARRRAA